MLNEYPTPWTLHWQGDLGAILDAGNRQVLIFRPVHPSESRRVHPHDLYELIVRCVNAHEGLCGLLGALRGKFKAMDEAAGPYEGMYGDTLSLIDDVLAKAKP